MKELGDTGKHMILCKHIWGLPDDDFSRNNFDVKRLYFVDMDDDTHTLESKEDVGSVRIIHSTLWFNMDKFNHRITQS